MTSGTDMSEPSRCPLARGMPQGHAAVSLILGVLGVCALLLTWWSPSQLPPTTRPAPPEASIRDQLIQRLPSADPLFLDRAACEWGLVAVDVADRFGQVGLETLDEFGEEAALLLEHEASGFESLMQVQRLDSDRFPVAAAHWRRALLEWAWTGDLPKFLRVLEELDGRALEIAKTVPECLPLLAYLPLLEYEHADMVEEVLETHGARAWRLMSMVDFESSPESLVRLATAIDLHRDLILETAEEHGFAAALMLVPPDDPTVAPVADVVEYALKRLPQSDDRSVAITLMISNYDSLCESLREGVTPKQLIDAIDLLRGQPAIVQELAAETPQAVRLLCEKRGDLFVGAQAFEKCGPAAADAFEWYRSDPAVAKAVLRSIAVLGWDGFEVFDQYREYGAFRQLIRRPELISPDEQEPFLLRAVNGIRKHGQSKIDVYLSAGDLRAQLMDEEVGHTDGGLLEWIPLYLAWRVTDRYMRGLHVSESDVIWASVDALTTAFPLKGAGKAGKVLKTAGRTASQVAARGATKAFGEAAEQLGRQVGQAAQSVLRREGVELAHLGENAGRVAVRRLEARGEGIALGLADRSDEYLRAARSGNLAEKSRIAEEIAMDGARRYAEECGYRTVYSGTPGQGRGFDFVFRDGNRVVVVEAKGGGSQIKHFHGAWQGSPEYSKAVAEDVLRRGTTPEERQAAEAVLDAYRRKTLDVEVVRTPHVQGRPQATRVESIERVSGARMATGADLILTLRGVPASAVGAVAGRGSEEAMLSLGQLVQLSEPAARRAGITLWPLGGSLTMPRIVRVSGRPNGSPVVGSAGNVGDSSIALMERVMDRRSR